MPDDYNPEADEISDDDLIAASDFYDRLVDGYKGIGNDPNHPSWDASY